MIRRFLDLLMTLEGIELILSIVLGVGLIGYVSASWAMHYWSVGKIANAAAISLATFTLAVAAILRVQIATYAVWGGGLVLGSLFLSGASSGLMP